ncbi:putative membrane protein [Streptococcus constellatus subsp. pharyngis SK1060 = CCUG 46377]|uniref:Putative membrane protein n=1 Tax=Streptococcus constellatus subsp. pharyngis SK1060 = CCUG 46377 TaxID=1035184 RepID=F9PAM8_STRCV|nr:putative membrane protein [Streptococcus constellatus subsp. pharyngis SK1060 = CCUG 46377]
MKYTWRDEIEYFLSNRNFRQLSINEWISTFGDTVFYLAFINYVSSYAFAPLAILMITTSETLPQIMQIFTGVVADFQKNRIGKYSVLMFVKFVLYATVALILVGTKFSLVSVFLICLINFVSDTIGYFSSAMITPIYVKIINNDMTSALGFKQATANLVRVFGNLSGGALIGFINIGMFAGMNALTFLFAFFGILLIRTNLVRFEEQIEVTQALDSKNFWKHLLDSLKILGSLGNIIKLIGILSINQAVINVTIPVTTLLLIKYPFAGLETGQSIAILTTVELIGIVCGNFLSGNVMKKMSTKTSVYLSQVMEFVILVGFLNNNFLVVLLAAFGNTFSIGILSPRLQQSVFRLVPEQSMGAVQSGISMLSIVLPGILSIVLVGIASSLGIVYVAVSLGVLLFLGMFLVYSIKNIAE